MKRNTFALLALFAPTCLFSQISLTRSEMLPVNSVFTLKTVTDYSLVDTTIQGENKTWDFTGLTIDPQGTVLTVTIKDPSKTAKGSEFTNSNYGYYESPNDAYRYFNLTDNKMERVGSYAAQTLKKYDDPQIEYVFPMVYGTQNSDTWTNNISSFGGTYSLTCIGSGTLKLPSGSFEALMVRVNVNEGGFEINSYFWYSATDGSILIQYLIGDGFFTQTAAKYQTFKSVGITEIQKDIVQFKMVNPVLNELNFTFNSTQPNLNFVITDLQGKVIQKANISSSLENVEVSEDVSKLIKGMYVIQVYSGDELIVTDKFVKN